jgi:hypothetical protein
LESNVILTGIRKRSKGGGKKCDTTKTHSSRDFRDGPILAAAIIAESSSPIAQGCRSYMFGAMRAAVNRVVLFDAVTDDLAAAMGAGRRQRVDGALKRIERVRLAVHGDLERLVIIVAANFTLHGYLLWEKDAQS